jgi:predicted DNA-binding transcriptional regulator YafY
MPHIKNALIRYRIIDKCIRNKYKPFPTKRDLRQACEESLFGSVDGEHICDSTIEKDMFAMKMEHDAPIKYSSLDRGYFYEDPDFSINDIPLTDDEYGAIGFAAKTLLQFKDTDLFQEFGNAIDKIIDRISVSKNENSEQYIQFEKSVSGEGNEHLSPILEAIKQKLILKFEYTSFISGEMKARTVLPLLLKEYGNRWYLISFDLTKEDFITYGLDRIEDLVVTTDKRERPENFNADNYFKYAIGITSGNTKPELVTFEATVVASKYVDSLPFHSSQKVIQMKDNGFVFSLEVNISEELIRAILSYGGEIKVIQPLDLKTEILNRASRIVNVH